MNKPRFADFINSEIECPDCKGTGVDKKNRICDTCNGVTRIEIDDIGEWLPAAPPCDCGCERWRDGKCANCKTPIEGR